MTFLQYLRQQTAQYILATSLTITTLTSCIEIKTEYSTQLNIEGIITEKTYRQEQYLNPIDNINPMKNIDPLFNIKKGRFITKQNEQFNIIINTKLGIFKLNDKDLYNLVEQNSQVVVTYREKFIATYDDVNGDGKKDLIERVTQGYELINVQPKN